MSDDVTLAEMETREGVSMNTADEYKRVLLPLLIAEYGADAETWTNMGSLRRIAQALAADPGVRAAVEREARADEWDLWHDATCPWMTDDGCAGDHKNPYDRQEPTDG